MVKLDKPFNREEHEPQSAEFDPLPQGWYAMRIVEVAKEKSKSSPGEFLKFRFEVSEEAHPKIGARVEFSRLNLWNTNPEAVRIAQGEFSAILYATDVIVVDDTDQLLGKPLAVKLGLKQATAEYPARNEVKGYDTLAKRQSEIIKNRDAEPIRGTSNGAATASSSPATSAASTGHIPGKMPWEK